MRPRAARPGRLDAALAAAGYFADEGLSPRSILALQLGKPLLLEGEPGVGKTEVAHVLARILGRDCIRLQCHEGIDAGQALYDWDHVRQLLHVRVAERPSRSRRPSSTPRVPDRDAAAQGAARAGDGAVLLIDEIDRADDAFEAFLLEFLGRLPDHHPRARHDPRPREPVVPC